MAGFREFLTGEVLTAANVNNFLMKQSVMVFADAAARTTALGAEVAEGMLTYNEDTEQLEVFDGTNFVLAAPEPPAQNLVEVKSAIFTGVQTASVLTGANVAVTSLTITHACADAANRLVLTANLGRVVEQGADLNAFGRVGAAFHDGTGLIGVGTSVGNRTAVGGQMNFSSTSSGSNGGPISIGMVHTPGDTASRTYTVRVINATSITSTIFVNRTLTDTNNANTPRTAATFTLMEVRA